MNSQERFQFHLHFINSFIDRDFRFRQSKVEITSKKRIYINAFFFSCFSSQNILSKIFSSTKFSSILAIRRFLNKKCYFLDCFLRFVRKAIVLMKKKIHEKLEESEVAEIENTEIVFEVFSFLTLLELLEVIIIKAYQLKKARETSIHKNRFKEKINELIDVIILLYSRVLSINSASLSSISKSIKSRKKKSKTKSFSTQWIVDSSQLYKIIKNILLNIYSLQQSLAYRSWQHRDKDISSIDDSSARSSIRSQTSKKTS